MILVVKWTLSKWLNKYLKSEGLIGNRILTYAIDRMQSFNH